MGITNTISELSKYFYEWHKNKYEEIHNSIISEIENLKSDISGIETKFNNIYNEIHNTKTGILKNIDTLTAQVNTLIHDMSIVQSDKADKSSLNTWTEVSLEYCDANGTVIENVSLFDLKLKVNKNTRIARLTGYKVPCWNTGSRAQNEQPVFVKRVNGTTEVLSSQTDYAGCPESSKVFIRIPQQYLPMFHAASSPGRACFFSVYHSDGLLYFTTLIKASYVEKTNLSIMWVYGDK